MRYATVTDLTARAAYSQLAEAAAPDAPNVDGELLKLKLNGADLVGIDETDQNAVSVAVSRLERVLDDASAEIDGYIGDRFVANPPPVLAVRCLDIALYRLFGGDAMSERYLIYKRAMDWLSAVSARKISLDGDPCAANNTGVHVSAGRRVFDEQSLKNY